MGFGEWFVWGLDAIVNSFNVFITLGSVTVLTVILQWFNVKATRNWYKRQLSDAKGRWDLRNQTDQRSTVVECFTLGWLNVILRQTWPSILEKRISALVTNSFQENLEKVLIKNKAKMPWKHIESISVEQVTLGLVPPCFKTCCAKFNASKQYLKLEMGTKWATSGFQIILSVKFKSNYFLPRLRTRLVITNLEVAGQVHLGLMLGNQAPGITCVEFSFADTPDVAVRVTPMGMGLKDIPGLPEAIRKQLTKTLTKQFVEPNRNKTDTIRIYNRLRTKARGGRGGLLSIGVLSLKDLRAKKNGEGSVDKPAGKHLQLYCQCVYGAGVWRTPVIKGESPNWNWEFDIGLMEEVQEGRGVLEFQVLNAGSLGEPQALGSALVKLWEIELVADSEPLFLSVPISGTHQSVLSVKLVLFRTKHLDFTTPLQSTAPPGFQSTVLSRKPSKHVLFSQTLSREDGREDSLAAGTMKSESSLLHRTGVSLDIFEEITGTGRHSLSAGINKHKEVPRTVSEQMEIVEQSNDKPSGHQSLPRALTGQSSSLSMTLPTSGAPISHMSSRSWPSALSGNLKSLAAVPEIEVEADSSATATPPSEMREGVTTSLSALNTLAQVTKLEEVLEFERERHRKEMASYQSYIMELDAQLAAERKRRCDEELRALIEGGRFLLHKVDERGIRHVWYSPKTHAVRWALKRQGGDVQMDGQSNGKTDGHAVNADSIAGVESASSLFPKKEKGRWGNWKRMMHQKKGNLQEEQPLNPANCFSIIFTNQTAIHLEVPLGGNGRSRDEWISAFQSLMEGQLGCRLKEKIPSAT